MSIKVSHPFLTPHSMPQFSKRFWFSSLYLIFVLCFVLQDLVLMEKDSPVGEEKDGQLPTIPSTHPFEALREHSENLPEVDDGENSVSKKVCGNKSPFVSLPQFEGPNPPETPNSPQFTPFIPQWLASQGFPEASGAVAAAAVADGLLQKERRRVAIVMVIMDEFEPNWSEREGKRLREVQKRAYSPGGPPSQGEDLHSCQISEIFEMAGP